VFSMGPAYQAAAAVERFGRENVLTEASRTFTILDRELVRLKDALERFDIRRTA